MQSWMEAAEQFRHGVLWPHWAYSPAFNAGEPRFIFYPPLSWILGGFLMLSLPPAAVPAVFTWIALTFSGWGMLALARRYTGNSLALLVAVAYAANPYMLFTAYERTAYAELLAAAWMPWLLRGALAQRPRLFAVAIPVALLWLTNAPAAVMGTYTLATLILLRVLWQTLIDRKQPRSTGLSPLLVPSASGLLLGLALAAFYILPAALERRYVQIASAIIPGMRVEDNFLFGHAGDAPHIAVVQTASWIAITLLGVTVAALLLAWRRNRTRSEFQPNTVAVLAILTLLLVGMLFGVSLPLWHILPELVFLQFPWRFDSVLACVAATALALALTRWRFPAALSILLSTALAGTATYAAFHTFRQGCEVQELPQNRVSLFNARHGVEATDEYTPFDADNDQLRWDNPAWWLATYPDAPGPNTVPNPAATIVNYDIPPPLFQTISGRAPLHLDLHVNTPQDLILNLRAYPAWVVRVNGRQPTWQQRSDGLIAVLLPPGTDRVDVHWRTLPDVYAGDIVTACALLATGWMARRSRRTKHLT